LGIWSPVRSRPIKVVINLEPISPSKTNITVDMHSDEGSGVAEVKRWAAKQFAQSFDGLLNALATEAPPSS
jgi:hypothetical protein